MKAITNKRGQKTAVFVIRGRTVYLPIPEKRTHDPRIIINGCVSGSVLVDSYVYEIGYDYGDRSSSGFIYGYD